MSQRTPVEYTRTAVIQQNQILQNEETAVKDSMARNHKRSMDSIEQ